MISRKSITALAAVATLGLAFAAAPASAEVYCKRVGFPKGCVARPAAAPVVVAPVAKTAIVATPGVGAPGVGVAGAGVAGGVGGPASGVGVLPGAGAGAAGGPGYGAANQNGGVNRAGRR